MVKFLVLWNTPQDPEAFERYYRNVQIPLIKQLPGLRRYTIGHHATAVRGEEPLLKSTIKCCYPCLLFALATQAKHDGCGIRRTELHGYFPPIAVDSS